MTYKALDLPGINAASTVFDVLAAALELTSESCPVVGVILPVSEASGGFVVEVRRADKDPVAAAYERHCEWYRR